MTGSVPSEQQLLMAGYILGDLSPEEAVAFEQLLATDPSLMQELAQLQQALDLAYGVEVQPPPHLRTSILKAHQTAPQTEQHLQSAAPSAAIAPTAIHLLALGNAFGSAL
jgi:anti-sigma factor RsiW